MRVPAIGTWPLRRRVAALCGAVAVVLATLCTVAVFTAQASNEHIDDVLNRTGPMRSSGESLTGAVVDQETGVRGYAISGQQADLARYDSGLAAERAVLDRIRSLVRPGDERVRAALEEVQRRADAWRSDVAVPVIEAVRARGPQAGQALVDQAATTEFDGLRAAIATLQGEIKAVRDVSASQARESGSTLVGVQIGTAALVVLAGAVLLLLLDRLVNRPITDLAGQVRAVADGAYDRHIECGGSPDLVALAADVDAMRRQIAAELAEVRTAREQIEWVNGQLKAQAEELTRSNRDLEQFAYVASHDLQEPLRKVASFCQLLQRRYAGKLDDRADQYIEFAVDGAQRMQRLINDLLAFSRIGRLTSGFTDVDLNRVLTEVRSQLEFRAGERAQIEWSGLPVVEGEEPLLTTLFVNLVGNSLKFRRPDAAPVVRVTAQRDGREWRITVQDNGIGIEPEFADKVFVIFQRLHSRDAYEGTGIGLAIVKKIVEYHGGRIWLEPDVAEGAAISFTLPVPIGHDDADADAADGRTPAGEEAAA